MDLPLIKLMGTFPKNILNWNEAYVVCCVTLDYMICKLFNKAGFIPFWITNTTFEVNDEDGVWRPGKISHRMNEIWYLDWAVHPGWWKIGDHPDRRGDRSVKVSFRPRTGYRIDSVLDIVFGQCGILSMHRSRLLLKSRALWLMIKVWLYELALCMTRLRELHTSVWV